MRAKITLYPLNDSPFSKELEIAKKEAEKSNYKVRHGAVIVDRKKRIVASGSNMPMDSNWLFWRLYSRQWPNRMLHAEFSALGKIPCDNVLKIFKSEASIDVLRGAAIYNYRLSKTGVTGVSRPCPRICWPALKSLGFKDAVYITRYNGQLVVAHEYF